MEKPENFLKLVPCVSPNPLQIGYPNPESNFASSMYTKAGGVGIHRATVDGHLFVLDGHLFVQGWRRVT